MEKDEIFVRLRNIIADVVKTPGLQLTDDMSAHDVDGWDSISNMTIISGIESTFGIHLKMRDIVHMKNIGDMCSIIQKRIA